MVLGDKEWGSGGALTSRSNFGSQRRRMAKQRLVLFAECSLIRPKDIDRRRQQYILGIIRIIVCMAEL